MKTASIGGIVCIEISFFLFLFLKGKNKTGPRHCMLLDKQYILYFYTGKNKGGGGW